MRLVCKPVVIVIVVLAATLSHARENAVLRTGFAISHDHHQQLGTMTRLFLNTGNDEYVDIETEKIVSFEPDDTPVPAPVATDAVLCRQAAAGTIRRCLAADWHQRRERWGSPECPFLAASSANHGCRARYR